jgi:hypothetical protein
MRWGTGKFAPTCKFSTSPGLRSGRQRKTCFFVRGYRCTSPTGNGAGATGFNGSLTPADSRKLSADNFFGSAFPLTTMADEQPGRTHMPGLALKFVTFTLTDELGFSPKTAR